MVDTKRGPVRAKAPVFDRQVWLIAFRAAYENRVSNGWDGDTAACDAIRWADVAVEELRKAGG
jgi:hypothetical protein